MSDFSRFRTLVLNADGVPLVITDIARSIGLVHIKQVAVELDFYKTRAIRDASGRVYTIPAVIMLKKYVHKPHRHACFSRRNLILRDDCECQYCGKQLSPHKVTVDHIIPRSRFQAGMSSTNWDNVVVACAECNQRKANKTPEEAGMRLRRPTRTPSYQEITVGKYPDIPLEWAPYVK